MTPKQIAFSRHVASGISLTDSYRRAYRTAQMSAVTIHREAHRLMQNPKVATKVETLRKKADGEVISQRVATREEVLATLTEFMERGEAKDSVRLKAAETLGKHYGLFTDRLAVEAPVRSSEEIMSELKERLVLLT